MRDARRRRLVQNGGGGFRLGRMVGLPTVPHGARSPSVLGNRRRARPAAFVAWVRPPCRRRFQRLCFPVVGFLGSGRRLWRSHAGSPLPSFMGIRLRSAAFAACGSCALRVASRISRRSAGTGPRCVLFCPRFRSARLDTGMQPCAGLELARRNERSAPAVDADPCGRFRIHPSDQGENSGRPVRRKKTACNRGGLLIPFLPVVAHAAADFENTSGCSAAWLARLLGVQEVSSSNLDTPTIFEKHRKTASSRAPFFLSGNQARADRPAPLEG